MPVLEIQGRERTVQNPVRLPLGKTLVFALTQGNRDENLFADIFPRYDYFMKWYGFKESHLIRACGVREENVLSL